MRKQGKLLTEGLMGLVVGASSLINGCASQEEAGRAGRDLLQVTMGLHGVANPDLTPEQRAALRYGSRYLRDEKRNKAIRASGTNVYVNVSSTENNNQWYNPNDFSTAFNYWNDKNGNGLISPDEFDGAGYVHSLSREEQVVFGSLTDGHKGEVGKFDIWNVTNNNPQKIYSNSGPIPDDKYIALFRFSTEELRRMSARGTCVITVMAGEKLLDSYRVEFTD